MAKLVKWESALSSTHVDTRTHSKNLIPKLEPPILYPQTRVPEDAVSVTRCKMRETGEGCQLEI